MEFKKEENTFGDCDYPSGCDEHCHSYEPHDTKGELFCWCGHRRAQHKPTGIFFCMHLYVNNIYIYIYIYIYIIYIYIYVCVCVFANCGFFKFILQKKNVYSYRLLF